MGSCSLVVTMLVFALLSTLVSIFLKWQPDIKTIKIKMVLQLALELTLMQVSKIKMPTDKVETLLTLALTKEESLATNQ